MLYSPWFKDDGPTSGPPEWAQHIRATWEYLDTHYKIKPGWPSKICIKQAGWGWNLSELKQIAQAAIYFEDAWVQLASIDNTMCQRNWQENPVLAPQSRSQAIATVGAIYNTANLIRLFLADEHRWSLQDRKPKEYRLSFVELLSRSGTAREVKFVSPALHTAADAVHWTGFTLNFVRSCLASKNLARYPTSVEGLRAFVTGRRTPNGASSALHQTWRPA